MALSRSLSLVVGGITTLVVAATLVYVQRSGWASGNDTVPAALAVAAGLVIVLVQHVAASRFHIELRRLCAHIAQLDRAEGEPPAYRAPMVLNELATAVDGSLGRMRRRIDELARQQRELEVHVRMADAQRRRADAILNAISDAVIVTDAFHGVVLANAAAATLLRFDHRRALHKPIHRVIEDAALNKLIKDMREASAADSGVCRRTAELRFDTPEGHRIFAVTLTSIHEAQDKAAGQDTAGVVTVLRDITRERQIADMKSDFVSNVSHELRTPLSCIKAYMEMLIDGEAQNEPTRQQFYSIVQGEANRLTRLIENLLNISRIESGAVRTHRELVDLSEVIDDVMDVMKPQARARAVALTGGGAKVDAKVLADRDMLYQAMLNLVSNAIKYTPTGGTVRVDATHDTGTHRVCVQVRDTGVGIPPADLPRIFDKFYRVANHKKLATGTGLGLNLVRHIIETMHGGTVRVESEPERGSAFTFSLPIAEDV